MVLALNLTCLHGGLKFDTMIEVSARSWHAFVHDAYLNA